MLWRFRKHSHFRNRRFLLFISDIYGDFLSGGQKVQNSFFHWLLEDSFKSSGICSYLSRIQCCFTGEFLCGRTLVRFIVDNDKAAGFFKAAVDHSLKKDLFRSACPDYFIRVSEE